MLLLLCTLAEKVQNPHYIKRHFMRDLWDLLFEWNPFLEMIWRFKRKRNPALRVFAPFLCTLVQKFRTHITLSVTLCVTCETCCLNGILFWRWFEDLNEKGTLHSVFLPRAWEDFFFRSCCCLYSSSTNFEFLHKDLDWLGHFLKKKHNNINPFI